MMEKIDDLCRDIVGLDLYATIIIGGEIGGLVSAALLAAAGKSVLLLEQYHAVGRCTATFSCQSSDSLETARNIFSLLF